MMEMYFAEEGCACREDPGGPTIKYILLRAEVGLP